MAKQAPMYNWGSEIKNMNDTLYNQLNDTYSSTARVINTKTGKNATTTNPPADSESNTAYDIGDIWINSTSNSAWILTSRTTNTAATWTLIT